MMIKYTFVILFIALVSIFLTSKLIKLQLFLVSFQPLFIILIIKFCFENYELINVKGRENLNLLKKIIVILTPLFNNYVVIAMIMLSVFPLLFLLMRFKFNKSTGSVRPYKYETLGDNMVSYVMTYIVPLTTLSVSSKASEFVGNVILFFIIMILYIRLDLSYINPVLIMLGYNIYKVYLCNLDGTSYAVEDSKYLVTMRKDSKMDMFLKLDNPRLQVRTIGENLLYEKKK